jgi:hypothetical protein
LDSAGTKLIQLILLAILAVASTVVAARNFRDFPMVVPNDNKAFLRAAGNEIKTEVILLANVEYICVIEATAISVTLPMPATLEPGEYNRRPKLTQGDFRNILYDTVQAFHNSRSKLVKSVIQTSATTLHFDFDLARKELRDEGTGNEELIKKIDEIVSRATTLCRLNKPRA